LKIENQTDGSISLNTRLAAIEEKLDAISAAVEKLNANAVTWPAVLAICAVATGFATAVGQFLHM